MAKIFGGFQTRELAAKLHIEDFESKQQIVKAWADDYHHGSLLKDNETSREQAFNHDFFGRILGYTQKPASPYNFEPKASTATGQIPDARIGHFDPLKNLDETIAVVELKGAKVPLDRPQQGHGNLSPVQQGFKYKPQYRGCQFVIVSNFYETRLYNDNQLDFESWTLDELADSTDDFLNLRVFILLLSHQHFVGMTGPSKTQELLLDIRVQEQEIGKRFYKDYSEARQSLIGNLWQYNDWSNRDAVKCVEFAQKLIDRMVFVCFAEDRGLLPENTMARVLRDSDSNSFGNLWSAFRAFFEAVDRGSEKLGIPDGYNGGLFAADPELDSLQIGDGALRKLANLGNYDFASQLSISVLGHIFEQSITDLEELRSRVKESGGFEETQLSRRKKDGIFYTPSHVVREIIDNSLGELLRTREEELFQEFKLSSDLSESTYLQRERSAFEKYQEFLHNLVIVDPACGSGAFLVEAFDYLVAENQRVGNILGPDIFSNTDFVNAILQRNLFGVDLNEESVEITKLSLWLKSASKGHKLTTLDGNIKCGNSLLSEPDAEGKHGFDWTEAFPSIFSKKGGFDVVVGNPPYVDSEVMVRTSPEVRALIGKSYPTAKGNWDLFVPFYQKAFDLTRLGGVCSMIIPNKILSAPYALELRKYIESAGTLRRIIDVAKDGIFDVDVYPVIVTAEKTPSIDAPVAIRVGLTSQDSLRWPNPDSLGDWVSLLRDDGLSSHSESTLHFAELFHTYSAASVSEAYELKEVIKDDPAATNRQIVNTGTIDPYTFDWGIWPITYIKGQYLYPYVKEESIGKVKTWAKQDKAIVAGMASTVEACYSSGDQLFPAKSTVVVTEKETIGLSAKVALAILNSEPFRQRFIAANQFNAMAGGYITITGNNLGSIPVPIRVSEFSDELERFADQALDSASELRSITKRIMQLLVAEFGEEVWSKRMKEWWLYDFTKFTKSLKISLTLTQKSEILELFETCRVNALCQLDRFKNAQDEINELMTEIYGS